MLTPVDIHNKEFSRSFRGFNQEEVDDFLDQVVNDYEMLYRDNHQMKKEIELCNKQLENIDAISSGILPQQEPASVKAAAPAVSVEDAVRSIESSMARIQPEPPVNIDIAPAKEVPAAKPAKSFDSTQPFTL